MKPLKPADVVRLAPLIWNINQNKGWHDPMPSTIAMKLNTMCEVAEMWEDYRRGRLKEPADKPIEVRGRRMARGEEEFADIAIRAMHQREVNRRGGSSGELDEISVALWEAVSPGDEFGLATKAVVPCALCKRLNRIAVAVGVSDPLECIVAKMEFNKTRPWRHGGLAA